MDSNSSSPIGIFDSGIGGLTVAKAIRKALPSERLVYFGDTAHLPYGDKSAPAIQAYSIKITDVLIEEGCKVIVIACNSASSAAYELLKEYSGTKSKIINVIDPMVDYVVEHHSSRKVGLIGTRQTIQSNIYQKKLGENGNDIDLVSLATPLLVPMIEEGFIHDKISHDIIGQYLGHSEFNNISSLILGCTHYPLIKDEIQEYFNDNVEVMASSDVVAMELLTYLKSNGLLNNSKERNQLDKFLVSDFTGSFEASSKFFFGESIHLEQYKLWE
jgi:glutamate racemase